MVSQLVMCTACGCHVRVGDVVCPHCANDLSAPSGTRRPERRGIRLQRVLLATAMAGLGSTACGGRTPGEHTNAASERDIWGACMAPDARVTSCSDLPAEGCQCGPAGACSGANGVCYALTCTPDEYLTSSGECLLTDGGLPPIPTHSHCYGSPPLLG
jgi:hypothetical protein